MLDEIARTCSSPDCERELTDRECALVYRTDAGQRRAYECACGAVTVTVVAGDSR